MSNRTTSPDQDHVELRAALLRCTEESFDALQEDVLRDQPNADVWLYFELLFFYSHQVARTTQATKGVRASSQLHQSLLVPLVTDAAANEFSLTGTTVDKLMELGTAADADYAQCTGLTPIPNENGGYDVQGSATWVLSRRILAHLDKPPMDPLSLSLTVIDIVPKRMITTRLLELT